MRESSRHLRHKDPEWPRSGESPRLPSYSGRRCQRNPTGFRFPPGYVHRPNRSVQWSEHRSLKPVAAPWLSSWHSMPIANRRKRWSHRHRQILAVRRSFRSPTRRRLPESCSGPCRSWCNGAPSACPALQMYPYPATCRCVRGRSFFRFRAVYQSWLRLHPEKRCGHVRRTWHKLYLYLPLLFLL